MDKLPTIEEVDTEVGELFQCLDAEVYTFKREVLGKNITYILRKQGKFMGMYRIRPGESGGSIQASDDKTLSDEWWNFVSGEIWVVLQQKFGPFPWAASPEPPKGQIEIRSETQVKLENVRKYRREFIKRSGEIPKRKIIFNQAAITDKTVKAHDPELISHWSDKDYA